MFLGALTREGGIHVYYIAQQQLASLGFTVGYTRFLFAFNSLGLNGFAGKLECNCCVLRGLVAQVLRLTPREMRSALEISFLR